ncbi:MAG TPA: transcriptional regulator [Ruminococcaceae bacterium]|mgnify:CR=1 FL=1|nr:transcriptional regulator [Oscillospiraceae bacterium]
MNPLDDQLCVDSIKKVMTIFGGKWTFLIMGTLYNGTTHFNELSRKLKISTKSLSDALKRLETHDIITRKVQPTTPITVEYALTEKGRDFQTIFAEMKTWGQKWLSEKEGDN